MSFIFVRLRVNPTRGSTLVRFVCGVLFSIVLLILASSATSLAEDSLTVWMIRSPGLDWSSPRSLTTSMLKHELRSHALGHVVVEIQCDDQHTYAGIANRWSDEMRIDVLIHGAGLGVLFGLFEGELQDPTEIPSELQKMASNGRVDYISFLISHDNCERAFVYAEQYRELQATRQAAPRIGKKDQHTTPAQQIYYGFPAQARLGEGAGCSGYAVSFLEVLGLKEQFMLDRWTLNKLVPQDTIGMPLFQGPVSILQMLEHSPEQWAEANEPNVPFFAWDPDLMFDDVQKQMQDPNLVTVRDGISGITLDRSTAPVPTEPIFLNDPFKAPTDPTVIYHDQSELAARWQSAKVIPLPKASEAPSKANRAIHLAI